MAIVNTAKAEALIRELKERLEFRTANAASGRVDTVRQDRDSDGYPALFLSDGGTETAGSPVIFIRIKQIDMVSKDIFGNAINAYAPHKCELAYELNQYSHHHPYVDGRDVTMVMYEIGKLVIKTDLKELDNGDAVTFTNVDAADVAESYDDLRWPTKGA